jgi:hypothetical protein
MNRGNYEEKGNLHSYISFIRIGQTEIFPVGFYRRVYALVYTLTGRNNGWQSF